MEHSLDSLISRRQLRPDTDIRLSIFRFGVECRTKYKPDRGFPEVTRSTYCSVKGYPAKPKMFTNCAATPQSRSSLGGHIKCTGTGLGSDFKAFIICCRSWSFNMPSPVGHTCFPKVSTPAVTAVVAERPTMILRFVEPPFVNPRLKTASISKSHRRASNAIVQLVVSCLNIRITAMVPARAQ
jgi:hypothetical protein